VGPSTWIWISYAADDVDRGFGSGFGLGCLGRFDYTNLGLKSMLGQQTSEAHAFYYSVICLACNTPHFLMDTRQPVFDMEATRAGLLSMLTFESSPFADSNVHSKHLTCFHKAPRLFHTRRSKGCLFRSVDSESRPNGLIGHTGRLASVSDKRPRLFGTGAIRRL
jgi:hypothetical protein